MKRLKDVLAALVVISFMLSASGGLSHAQPNIPRGKIPSDIPSDVREQFEKLYSSDPIERAYAAVGLGNIGKRAAHAVPFLIGMLNDRTSLFRSQFGTGVPTSPGEEAARALGKIGEPAVEPLIAALKAENSDVRRNAATALREIKDPRAVEPLIDALKDKDAGVREDAAWALWGIRGRYLGVDPAKWQEWWERNQDKFRK